MMRKKLFPDCCNSPRFSFVLKFLFVFRKLLSVLLFQEKCICCGMKAGVFGICHKCMENMALNSFARRCRICGRELVGEIDTCMRCRATGGQDDGPVIKSCDGVFPLYSYRFWKKDLLFQWKIEGRRVLTPFFAFLIFMRLKEVENHAGMKICVVPVPPRPGKIREKGWDQIDEICMFLSRFWNISVLKLLKRLSKMQQKKLDRVQRLENTASAYIAKSNSEIKRIVKKIPECTVLIDDVLTTGATLENCALQLKKIGVQKVYAVTLFIAD